MLLKTRLADRLILRPCPHVPPPPRCRFEEENADPKGSKKKGDSWEDENAPTFDFAADSKHVTKRKLRKVWCGWPSRARMQLVVHMPLADLSRPTPPAEMHLMCLWAPLCAKKALSRVCAYQRCQFCLHGPAPPPIFHFRCENSGKGPHDALPTHAVHQ